MAAKHKEPTVDELRQTWIRGWHNGVVGHNDRAFTQPSLRSAYDAGHAAGTAASASVVEHAKTLFGGSES